MRPFDGDDHRFCCRWLSTIAAASQALRLRAAAAAAALALGDRRKVLASSRGGVCGMHGDLRSKSHERGRLTAERGRLQRRFVSRRRLSSSPIPFSPRRPNDAWFDRPDRSVTSKENAAARAALSSVPAPSGPPTRMSCACLPGTLTKPKGRRLVKNAPARSRRGEAAGHRRSTPERLPGAEMRRAAVLVPRRRCARHTPAALGEAAGRTAEERWVDDHLLSTIFNDVWGGNLRRRTRQEASAQVT